MFVCRALWLSKKPGNFCFFNDLSGVWIVGLFNLILFQFIFFRRPSEAGYFLFRCAFHLNLM